MMTNAYQRLSIECQLKIQALKYCEHLYNKDSLRSKLAKSKLERNGLKIKENLPARTPSKTTESPSFVMLRRHKTIVGYSGKKGADPIIFKLNKDI